MQNEEREEKNNNDDSNINAYFKRDAIALCLLRG